MQREIDDFVARPERHEREIAAVNTLRGIYDAYTQYPTDEHLRREGVLRRVMASYHDIGFHIDVFIGGSFAAGQSVEDSDLDVLQIALRAPSKTPANTLGAQRLLDSIGLKMERELGHPISIGVIGERIIDLSRVEDFLNSNQSLEEPEDEYSFHSTTLMIPNLVQAYYYTQIGRTISSSPRDIMELIQQAEHQHPYLAINFRNILGHPPGERLGYYAPAYIESFTKYEQRLKQNPRFVDLPLGEQTEQLEYIHAMQAQFIASTEG